LAALLRDYTYAQYHVPLTVLCSSNSSMFLLQFHVPLTVPCSCFRVHVAALMRRVVA
jgi:hypothetical protein